VSAIAGDPQRNLDFYTGFLGLRLVKRTVNFDDPQTYHLYYADGTGTPGSIMTCFPWPGAHRGRPGSGQVAVTSFAVLPSAIGFWIERLLRHGIRHEGPLRRRVGAVTEQVLSFADPDGLMLEIVGHPGAETRPAWDGAPGVSSEQGIHGFHSVTLWVDERTKTEKILTELLGFREVSDDDSTRRYSVGEAMPGKMLNVRIIGGFGEGRGGAGTVHHVAFAVADDTVQAATRAGVVAAGLHPTGVLDRKYFRSVYFREPGGVLFELATMKPGFTLDEPVAQLGGSLMLPEQFEPERATIEAVLPPLHLRVPGGTTSVFAETTGPEDVSGDALGFVHRYVPPSAEGDLAGGTTLLLLHGTGGDESDLLPLGRALLPGAALLSPRGKVLERGAPRFFRRLSEGVFDLEDLALRTAELADFIEAASRFYQLNRDRIIAVGFSNGANIAASLLLRGSGGVRRAVLLSPMMPFEPQVLPDLAGTGVFIGAGKSDPIVPVEQVTRLVAALEQGGAKVTVHWEQGGHGITSAEVDAARTWIMT
jgi:predicted esterase/catechol 2,3-dioxygenase-like lactoylglutathione lyase family enzyme